MRVLLYWKSNKFGVKIISGRKKLYSRAIKIFVSRIQPVRPSHSHERNW